MDALEPAGLEVGDGFPLPPKNQGFTSKSKPPHIRNASLVFLVFFVGYVGP